jgi:hypothetical protein
MAIFICWDETDADPIQEYVGGGAYDTHYVNVRTVTRKCRYSNEETPDMMERANAYAADMTDKVNVRVTIE